MESWEALITLWKTTALADTASMRAFIPAFDEDLQPMVDYLMTARRRLTFGDSELPLERRPSLWVLSELPITHLPPDFVADLSRSGHLIVLEAHGGLGQMISHVLLTASVPVSKFTHHRAHGYLTGLYGSQKFHRNECGLSPDSVLESSAWEHSVQSLLVALSKPNVS